MTERLLEQWACAACGKETQTPRKAYREISLPPGWLMVDADAFCSEACREVHRRAVAVAKEAAKDAYVKTLRRELSRERGV